MKKEKLKRTILAIGVISIMLGTTVVFSEPGSEKDPLVSLSYLEKSMEQIKLYIDDRLGEKGIEDGCSNNLTVVEIASGQSIIGKSGTEIILRGGQAKVIAGELGGLSDVTQGKNLDMDRSVPANHLLIVPRDDDRGVLAVTESIFLVRGKYEIR